MNTIYAEIITIGDELLYGQVTDTNSKWISQKLDELGIKVRKFTSIGDNEVDIEEALSLARKKSNLILITGGLGPTKDDITKKTLAHFFNTNLEVHPKTLEDIKSYFIKRGREIPQNLENQALMPENAEVLYNTIGTAPAMWFDFENTIFVSMPGVPKEMELLMNETVLPKIKEHFDTPTIFHKSIHTFGVGESKLSHILDAWEDSLPEHIKLAYLPDWGEVKLRLTAFGEDINTLTEQVQIEIDKIFPKIEKYIFGYDGVDFAETIGHLVKSKNKTIATAESCTGGYLAHLFTKVAGSSTYYKGGIVAYSNDIKNEQLDVNEDTLKNHGAVSEATIIEMAENVRKKYKTDIGIASSGVAGPGGGSSEKPVGTIWIAYADEKGTYTKKLQLTQDRWLNILFTSKILLNVVRRKLTGTM